MSKNYDVIIIGGGPAGIFAALELSQAEGLSVLLIEKGKDISQRQCPVRDTGSSCIECLPCNLVCGLGGAGAFSDGKLTLSSQTGGHLAEYQGEANTEALIKHVDEEWKEEVVLLSSTIHLCLGSGCPIVVSDAKIFEQYGRQVLKYRTRDRGEFKECLTDVFEEKERVTELRQAVREFVGRDSAQVVAEKYIGLFESLQ